MQRKWLIMAAASLAFFFVTGTTFTSLGVVLYTMVAELHWSQSAAGFSFSLLGLSCGLSSHLPAVTMKRIGSRWTLFAGGMVLALGFALAALSHSLAVFFVATSLMGIGFTLMAPVPGIYLIATWFPNNSSRMIGFYFMAGACGGVFGPPLVEMIVDLSGSWRLHWAIMSGAAALIGVLSLLAIKDLVPIKDADEVERINKLGPASDAAAALDEPQWTSRQAVLTRQFLLIALAMLIVQAAVTTIHSMFVTHIVHLGGSRAFGAFAMSALALTGTLTKGIAGTVAERVHPKTLLVGGMVLQCLAFLLLGLARAPVMAYAFAVIFGAGWGASWLSAHVLLLRYFGRNAAAGVVATATMLTTAAVLGPVTAGMIADSTGSFTPIFFVYVVLLALVTASTAMMRAPLHGLGPLRGLRPLGGLGPREHSSMPEPAPGSGELSGIGQPLRVAE